MYWYIVYLFVILMFFICLWLVMIWLVWYWGVGLIVVMVVLGIWDLLQKCSMLCCNYLVMVYFCYGLEFIGLEICQYFVQSDLEDVLFLCQQCVLIYQCVKNEMDMVLFGILCSIYVVDYEWINYLLVFIFIVKYDFCVLIGLNCVKFYLVSVFNILVMSFGLFLVNVICVLNEGVWCGGFYYDIGEGLILFYYCEMGGDLVWEIGLGYFGCCDEKGGFSEECFVVNVIYDQVKMIEIKLLQGVKLGYGGVLLVLKVIVEILVICGVLMGVDCVLLLCYLVFLMLVELLQFVVWLCELFGGKLVGFKLVIGYFWEWFGIVKVMQEIGLLLDFIVVDGVEGGIGVVLVEFVDYVGVLMYEVLLLVYNILVGLDLCECICIGVVGKIISVFDIVCIIVLGVDWCNVG